MSPSSPATSSLKLRVLIKYYKEYNNSGNVVFNVDPVKANCSGNSMIAFLLKESSLPLSKLVESIFDKVKEKIVELVMSLEEREAHINALREEVDGLIKYYKEYNNSGNVVFNVDSVKANCPGNSMIVCLLEESSLPVGN
ncbi:hypothetical protein L6452_02117 [Arctium lappa]|uniref:Uncharacterized protein n=1 Tax=Arctium lappa TaxID=4217 RepID=A0ACB9FI85_ARCLA|nr:hypothetical protein L6452_02117 [Arctium lappa]